MKLSGDKSSVKNADQRKIIFFDGICNFCNAGVDFYIRHDKTRKLHFTALQSDFAQKFLRSYGIDSFDISTLYYYEAGKLYQKSSATAEILKHFGISFRILSFIIWLTPKFISDFIYDLIAQNRYRILGRRQKCRVPLDNEKEFFLA